MAKLEWDKTGERLFETGVSNCALYLMGEDGAYLPGVAWNGVSGIDENPSGAEASAVYADNTKYLNLYSLEEYKATIKAYTYPDEFAKCNGEAELLTGLHFGQQSRQTFGLVFKTNVGNDIVGSDYGYKLHIVYGLRAGTTSKSHNTINDSPEAEEMSWELSSTPINAEVNGVSYTNISTITIDSTAFADESGKSKLTALEDQLFGENPTLLLPAAVYAALK